MITITKIHPLAEGKKSVIVDLSDGRKAYLFKDSISALKEGDGEGKFNLKSKDGNDGSEFLTISPKRAFGGKPSEPKQDSASIASQTIVKATVEIWRDLNLRAEKGIPLDKLHEIAEALTHVYCNSYKPIKGAHE